MTALTERRIGFRNAFYSFCACFFALVWTNGTVRANAQISPPANSESAKSAPDAASRVKGFTLPFTPLPDHGGVIVRVRINNTMDANFFLDTGADDTYITSRLVKALGLTTKQAPYVKSGVALPPGTPTQMVSIDRLRMGNMDVPDVEVYVSDFVDSVTGYMKGQNVEGIVGAGFLQYTAILFDFANKNLVLIPGGHLDDAQLAILDMPGGVGSGIALKGFPTAPLRMMVPVQIEVNKHTATLPLIIDTGARSTAVFDPTNDLKLKKGVLGAARYQFGSNGLITEYVLLVTAFFAGDKERDAQRTNLAPFECGLTVAKSGIPSVLGLDYLSHFRVLLDYPARRLYLTPVSNPSGLPFPTESSRECAHQRIADAKLAPSADGKWEVVSTEKQGIFGGAGVQVGDILETVNGKKPDGLLYFAMTTLFQESGSKPAVVQLRRDGKIVQVSVELMPKK